VSIQEKRALPDARDCEYNVRIQDGSSDCEGPSALEGPSDQDNAQQLQSFDLELDKRLQRSSALMLLGLKEKHKLAQSTIQSIVNGVTGLFQQHVDAVKSQVTNCIAY